MKAKKQRYREKRKLKATSPPSEHVLSSIDPNVLVAVKSYIKFVDEQIDQNVKIKVNKVEEKLDQSIESDIIINTETTSNAKEIIMNEIEETDNDVNEIKIEETENNAIVNEIDIEETENFEIVMEIDIEETQSNVKFDENVEADIKKLTAQLNRSLSNGLLSTSINGRINRYGFIEYAIVICDKSFIQPINGEMTIYRRYNDFYVFNGLLMASGFNNLPLLPRKRIFKFIHDENFIDERQQQLDNYLKAVINLYPIQSAGVKNLIKTFIMSRLTAMEEN